MPIWEKTYMERAVELSDSGADAWDLPKRGWLSALIVNLHAQNDSLHNRNNQIWEHLDKIEVIHRGTEVIKSLKYCEPHALNVLDMLQMPQGRRREGASEWCWDTFLLNFGRGPRDLEYGLRLEDLVDPELKLEWNLDLAADGTADQFETGSLELNVIALMLRKLPAEAYLGYIKSSEIDHWTGVHDKEHKVELPPGNDYRRLMVRSFLYGFEIYPGLWYNELDLDRGTRVPVKLYGKEWLDVDNVLNGYKGLTNTLRMITGAAGAVAEVNSNFGKIEGFGAEAAASDNYVTNASVSGNVVSAAISDATHTLVNNGRLFTLVSGIAPFNCLAIPFDKPSMDYNLKSEEYSDIDLKIKSHYEYMSGEELQDIRVVLEEVIKPS